MKAVKNKKEKINDIRKCILSCLNVAGCNKWSIDDMWRMIWQVGCCRIVMVTNLVEKGKVSLIAVTNLSLNFHLLLPCP